MYGALAQSVEHLTFNQVVRGSNPRCFIINISIFYVDVFYFVDIPQIIMILHNI